MKKAVVIIPTYNGGRLFQDLLESLDKQLYKPSQIIIIDSSSSDGTDKLAKRFGLNVVSICQKEFNHGGTRQKGIELSNTAELFIFLTQDAVLESVNSLDNIINCFNDYKVGAAYGRQLPHVNSGLLGAHARLFNYPKQTKVKSIDDAKELGIKTAFISNSFAAYRREAIAAVGGFPKHTILGEDTYVAAKMILSGWKVAYCAESSVYHSHDYNYLQEFRRYFDIGAFHAKESWIREKLGNAEGEGMKFVLSEIKYLLSNDKWYLLPSALIRTVLKFLGYRLGLIEREIPVKTKKLLSMHSSYWDAK